MQHQQHEQQQPRRDSGLVELIKSRGKRGRQFVCGRSRPGCLLPAAGCRFPAYPFHKSDSPCGMCHTTCPGNIFHVITLRHPHCLRSQMAKRLAAAAASFATLPQTRLHLLSPPPPLMQSAQRQQQQQQQAGSSIIHPPGRARSRDSSSQ